MPNNSLPTHVGIILDGNRRWAKQQGLPSLEGHRRGAETFKQISLHAFEKGVSCLSAYIFSQENWQRTDEEVGYLMQLVMKAVESYLDEYHKRGIKIVVLGRREGLRRKVLDAIKHTEEKTKDNAKGILALCFNYGGQQEIADAATAVKGEMSVESLRQALYEPAVPDLDLVIRTSGEQRLSGFMLWRAAYAELYFTPVMWPAFTPNDFDAALDDYASRQRRFGQ
ncbi:MAG TPA: polyprenyl diphosphate synthase [Patescibacteria group bacterium]|nr:polyprenyl diphosphate synthase [Patescibacteria group bacterium]